MKRIFPIILALCLVLTGCGIAGQDNTLLDNREAFDDSGALWYIPNTQLESQLHPSMYSFDGELLTVSSKYVNDGKSTLTLTLLSSSSGEALQTCALELSGNTDTQCLDENVIVYDFDAGAVIVLDKKLREVARYTVTPDDGQWFLAGDLDTLYKCSYDGGIRAVTLSTGKERSFLEMAELSICSVSDSGICFTGVDLKTQKCRSLFLDLSSGELVEQPFSGDFSRLYRSGKLWLGGFYGEEDGYAFGTDSNARFVTAKDGSFSLLGPQEHILFSDYEGKQTLYDATGAFISSCDLPGLYIQNFVWQEELGGYLMLAGDSEDNCKLLFWDIGASTEGADLKTRPISEHGAVAEGTKADADLYERAQALADRYGVEILIADRCETEFPSFSCYQLTDRDSISGGLDILEQALSVFPKDFFSQLVYGHIERTQFQLVGGLTATNGFGGDTTYAAFRDANGSVCRIVIDVHQVNTSSIWHEISHAVDKRLAWDATYRSGALFSEDGWLARCPNGFAYTEDYSVVRSDIQPDWYSYFVDDYSMTNSTEDRARIFENAIANDTTLFESAGLEQKLQYYCDCIRDCFDTAQWPKTLPWEAPLR